MSFVRQLEDWHNRASDTSFVWFPFLFLKPEPNARIDFTLVLKMTLCFGVYYGFFAALRSWVFHGGEFWVAVGYNIVIASVFFIFWFTLVTAKLWNRRALRLKQAGVTNKEEGTYE